MRWLKIILLGAVICVAGGEFLACDQMPPIDENFDSSLGADFKAPPEDAGADAATAAVEADTP
ncbi:MAG TPA: hypothetical protein VLC06_12375 [Polyangia bacterium]|jgi:hypothetical protein|nr:hypothetical protein [Polyangia bacterium]